MDKMKKMKENKFKLIRLLKHKKYRSEYKLFLVEGEKNTAELLDSDWGVDYLLVTDYFFNKYKGSIENKKVNYEIVSQDKIEGAGTLETNNSAIAIVRQKERLLEIDKNGIIIALDKIQDPGNFGSIIRTADWYGIKNIITSKTSVDLYNPKVISASKGSFTRVQISSVDLVDFLTSIDTPIIGSFLDGQNIHNFKFPKSGILVLGNESNGISREIEKLVDNKITIPASVGSSNGAQSLNISIATAVIVDNWKRNISNN